MSEELDKAIAAVSAEAEKEVNAGAEVTPEPEEKEEATSPEPEAEETPAEEAEEDTGRERDEHGRFVKKDAPAEEEEEEEPLELSAEDLAAINADPRLQRAYKSMQRGLTKKTMSLAEQRKQNEQRAALADWIQADPDKAIAALAAARGKKLADEGEVTEKQAKKEVVDSLEKRWLEAFGDSAENKKAIDILKPLFEETAAFVVDKYYNEKVAPLAERVAEHDKDVANRSIAAAQQEFGARIVQQGGEWTDEIQGEMADVVERLEPGKKSNGEEVTIDEYLQDVYNIVMYNRNSAKSRRAELKRLRAAREADEPTTSMRPPKDTPSKITGEMSDKDAAAMATALAMKELGVS